MTQALTNVPSSGTEAAKEMEITLCPWKHVRESVGVWWGSAHLHLAERAQGEGRPGVLWEQGHNNAQIMG